MTTDPWGRVLEEWSTRLNPQGPVGATHIHGITAADVAHAPVFTDVLAHLNARLAGAGRRRPRGRPAPLAGQRLQRACGRS